MRKLAAPLTLALFVLSTASTVVRAQDSTAVAVPAPSPDRTALYGTPLRVGTWVRVTQDSARDRRVTGTLLLANGSRISIASRDGDPLTIAPDAVRRLEVSQGRTGGAGMRKGAKVGLMVGIATSVVGFALGSLADSGNPGCGECSIDITGKGIAVLLALPITLTTTGLGALIGAGTGGEQWRSVPLPVRTVPRDTPAGYTP
ncbi:MAG: hypothetical protein JWM27_30 [Gemmatimonadetes bacterium]|nr:hypothetical protein [Gemmatimonadota bacterium]